MVDAGETCCSDTSGVVGCEVITLDAGSNPASPNI